MFLFLRFLCCFSVVFLIAAPEPVTYSGLTIECDRGCPDFWEKKHPEFFEIDQRFRNCIKQTVNKFGRDYLYEVTEQEIFPWERESRNAYSIFNWRIKFTSYFDSKIFKILDSHDHFLEVADLFREDLEFYHHQNLIKLRKKFRLDQFNLQALYEFQSEGYHLFKYEEDENGDQEVVAYGCRSSDVQSIELGIKDLEESIARSKNNPIKEQQKYEEAIQLSDKTFQEIDGLFKEIFVWCLKNHQPEGMAFHGALEYFLADDLESALERIRFLIDLSEKQHLNHQLLAKLYLLRGQVQEEAGLYADAIIALTTAIQKDSTQTEAYFERAMAYFELGQFDQALEDYLHSDFQNGSQETKLQWKEATQLSAGIGVGILKGAGSAAIEFVPGILSSLRGVGHGLWAFCSQPVGASQHFVNAVLQCIEYLKRRPIFEIAKDLVPELKELIKTYDQLNDYQKGELIGTIIGKYGLDIFLGNPIAVIKHYTDLKKANKLMTLEALAYPRLNEKIRNIATQRFALREQVFSNQNRILRIHWDKQQKHIEGSNNYHAASLKSIFDHPDPDRLLIKAGTGIKTFPSGRGGHRVGSVGSQELVNFEEKIGYYVHAETGERIATTWGKIHYAKNNYVHIVPTKPLEKMK